MRELAAELERLEGEHQTTTVTLVLVALAGRAEDFSWLPDPLALGNQLAHLLAHTGDYVGAAAAAEVFQAARPVVAAAVNQNWPRVVAATRPASPLRCRQSTLRWQL